MEQYRDCNLNRNEVINLLLESIAKEELALAHILYAEGDKIDLVIKKLKHHHHHDLCKMFDQLLDTNESVRKMIVTAIKKEMLLEFKLDKVLDLIDKPHHH